jgi:hypothetical protein
VEDSRTRTDFCVEHIADRTRYGIHRMCVLSKCHDPSHANGILDLLKISHVFVPVSDAGEMHSYRNAVERSRNPRMRLRCFLTADILDGRVDVLVARVSFNTHPRA